MTREDALKWVNIQYLCETPSLDFNLEQMEGLIDKIYDDFEEELKKAYIEGGNDAWKALNCKELAK